MRRPCRCSASFGAQPDLTPYIPSSRSITISLEVNTKTAFGGKASQRMNFAKEDAADDIQLNEIIWKSIRGANSRMPAPRHAAFVFTKAKKVDDDD